MKTLQQFLDAVTGSGAIVHRINDIKHLYVRPADVQDFFDVCGDNIRAGNYTVATIEVLIPKTDQP